MAYGNNRSAAKPRAIFQVAGGTIVRYRHSFLAGQIDGASQIDEIDVSGALRLNDTFLQANPNQDSSVQEVMIDGSTITITNHILAGRMTLNVLQTTGFVATGDFIAALQLVQATKDDIGGTLTVIEYIQGKQRTTIFYGVSVKHVPHLIKAGNAVVPYPVELFYSGWIQGEGSDSNVTKSIWAVGSEFGLSGVYKPFEINSDYENQGSFYGGNPLNANKNSLLSNSVPTDEQDNTGISSSTPPGGNDANVAAVPATTFTYVGSPTKIP